MPSGPEGGEGKVRAVGCKTTTGNGVAQVLVCSGRVPEWCMLHIFAALAAPMEEERFANPRAQALYEKSREIRELAENILEAAPEGGKHHRLLRLEVDAMYGSAIAIPAKIAGAEGGGLYDIRMENAAIIRKAARDLVVGLRGLEMYGYDEQPWFNLLRKEMEEFRLLFVEWVRYFDRGYYLVDDWGLFNPPGVEPGDEGPDLDFGGERGYL